MQRFKSWLYFRWFYSRYIGDYIRGMHLWHTLGQICQNTLLTAILDVGCGGGTYTYEVAKRFPSVLTKGIDLDVDDAKNKWPILLNLTFEIGDATKLIEKNHYSLIFCIDVLDDIPNWHVALRHFHEALKERGFLYIHFPKHPRPVQVLRINQIIKYWEKDVSYSTAKCSTDDLKRHLEKLGFHIIYERVTFGRLAVFAQEISLLLLMQNRSLKQVLRYTISPFLKLLAKFDVIFSNKSGNGLAILCQKL